MAILGFLTIPWLGPIHTEPHVPSVPKAKLGHSNCVRHRVILALVMAILGFLTMFVSYIYVLRNAKKISVFKKTIKNWIKKIISIHGDIHVLCNARTSEYLVIL